MADQYFKIENIFNILVEKNVFKTEGALILIFDLFKEKTDQDIRCSLKKGEKTLKKVFSFLNIPYAIEDFQLEQVTMYFLKATNSLKFNKSSEERHSKIICLSNMLYIATLFIYAYINPKYKLSNIEYIQDKIYQTILIENILL